MKFEFLADRPEAVNLVAGWYFGEWGRFSQNSSVERVAKKISQSMNKTTPPLLLLVTDRDAIVGAVELKYREMDIYPDKEHWLGGLFVKPEYRNLGLGEQLVEQVVRLAESFNIQQLYLQTERLDGGLYARLGWQALEQVCNKGIKVLVMERRIGAPLAPNKSAN